MSPRSWLTRVEDILESIASIQGYIEGMTFESFASDKKTLRAVAFEMGTIGEAARHIPPAVQGQYPHIQWAKMRAMRNTVIHEYFRLDVSILWKTITEDLPPLVPLLQKLLESLP